MISPRWRKVLKDLWSNKMRTLLVIMTIMVGVFAVGYVALSFDAILTNMDADFQSVNPHAATIYTMPFDDDLVHVLSQTEGVSDVEGRSQVGGSVLAANGNEVPIAILGIPALNEMHIDRLRPSGEARSIPALNDRELYIEQSAIAGLNVTPGDVLKVILSDGTVREMRVAGIVHDVTSIPYVFTQQVQAYTTIDSMPWLGGSSNYTNVYLTVAEDATNEAHVRAVAAAVAEKIERSGRDVYFTLVYQPGKHFASQITQALGALMGFMGVLAVGLSAFLVVNTVSALLTQHIRQIGVMKSVGARTRQLIGMYLVLVSIFGLLALAIAAPLAIAAANMTLQGISVYLNFKPGTLRISPTAIILQVFVAVGIPVIAALLPVLRGTRITIREAISSYGLGKGGFGSSWVDRLVERIRGLPRPMLISLRNTFRRKMRLLLTLSSLTMAGAIFVAVFNLRSGMRVALDQTLGYILSDVNVTFNQAYRFDKIEPLVMGVPEVVKVEGWATALGEVLTEDRETSTQVAVFAPPSDSTLIEPTITGGRWLKPEDENAIVIGNHFQVARPELKIGDTINISFDGKETEWVIVGSVKMAFNVVPPIVYANREYLQHTLGQANRVGEIRIRTSEHTLETQQRVADQLEQIFEAKGIQFNSAALGVEILQQNTAQTDILVAFMLVMAVLVAIVGGLGLASTMSMNVLERTREIGVIRAIGASDFSVLSMVVVEGMFVGVLSWMIGSVLSIPIGIGLNYAVGMGFWQTPLDFVFAWDGVLVWLAMVVIISAVASFIPARNATRLTVREVLAYE